MVKMLTTGKKIISLLNPYVKAKFDFAIYKVRYLALYILFGFTSLILEIIIRSFLLNFNYGILFPTIFSWSLGVLFAFYANANYNFKIPKNKKNMALYYFIIISFISFSIQLFLIQNSTFKSMNYEFSRLIISGILFLFVYFVHRKLSFKNFKKVGVAIYANNLENIHYIYNSIEQYPDFIHIDIIDKTMDVNSKEVKIDKIDTMKAYWPKLQIQTHIMSYHPSIWIKKILIHSDVIFVHFECRENILDLFKIIREAGKKPGLAINIGTEIKEIVDIVSQIEYLLLLTIKNPGTSGQKFDLDGLDRINEINKLSFRNNFTLCVDGGINENIVSILDAENIVSGSSVLNSANPKRQIMKLQTMGRYDSN